MLISRRILTCLLGFLLILVAPWLAAEPSLPGGQKDKNVLARFVFRPGGEAILLPIKFNDKTYDCLLDTVASLGVYDTSLPLGKALATLDVESLDGPIKLNKHAPPKAFLGDMTLHGHGSGFVIAYNFTKIRQVIGEPIQGIIGMDFLRSRVVQLDFDVGEIRFLRAADASCGQMLPLQFCEQGCPTVRIKIAEVGELDFFVNTGRIGLSAGDLNKELLERLIEKKHFKVVGKTRVESLKGTTTSLLVQGKALTVGDFTVPNPILREGLFNNLSNNFLARFMVTFDFPKAKMYLKKGKGFAAPELRDLSGLSVLRVDGKTIVHRVTEDSPAALEGIKAKDQLLKVGDKLVNQMTLFQLRKLLATAEPMLECTMRRGDEERKVVLKLK